MTSLLHSVLSASNKFDDIALFPWLRVGDVQAPFHIPPHTCMLVLSQTPWGHFHTVCPYFFYQMALETKPWSVIST